MYYILFVEYWYKNTRLSASRFTHSGIYHCCTFCSSGGKKEIICGCKGTMPGKDYNSKIKFLNRTTEYVLNIKTNFFMILIP